MSSSGFRVNFDIGPLVARTKRAELALYQQQSDLLDILGTMLLAQVQQAYVIKARGGTGEDGIKWAPLKESTIAARKPGKVPKRKAVSKKPAKKPHEIGRDTGKQINTLQPGRSGDAGKSMAQAANTITVGAAMSYSEYFDKHRQIIPDVLPTKWMEELQDEATAFAATVIAVELDKP